MGFADSQGIDEDTAQLDASTKARPTNVSIRRLTKPLLTKLVPHTEQ